MKAEVTRRRPLTMQVCVPKEWDDDQIEKFANETELAGTSTGWHVCKQGDSALDGDDERVPCNDRPGFIHVVVGV